MSFSTTQINRQTIEILNTNSLHFIPISLLFLPFTFSACIIVQFYVSSTSSLSPTTDFATYFDPFNLYIIKAIITNSQHQLTLKSLIKILAVNLSVILPTVAGIGLITYSTNQAIHNKPLTFLSTFKSLLHSYIHLFSTIIAGLIKLIVILILFTLSPIALTLGIKALGFHFGLFAISVFINNLASYALVNTIGFYMLIWGSAASIAVLELKSGFEPLTQSANRLNEFHSGSFFKVLLTGFVIGPSLSYCANLFNIWTSTNWIWILQVCAICLQFSLMILYYVVANTVLYVQCKVAGDEDPEKKTIGGGGKVSGEYGRVSMNEKDDQVSNELGKGYTSGGFDYIMYFLCIVWLVSIVCMLFKILGFVK